MRHGSTRLIAGLLAASFAAALEARPAEPQARLGAEGVAATIDAANRAAYNLDTDEALELARRAIAMAPDDSAAHRTLASIVWLNILFRRGAVTIDHYLGGSVTRSNITLPKPPPDLDAEFKRELARALEIAETRLKAQPRDLQARFEMGSAYALQASYSASVEGSMTAAFSSARRAYDAQEEVLTKDPKRVDAGVVVGTYRYVVSALSLPSRLIAYVAGFGGDKEKGISLLEAATRHPDTRVDAKTALMLIYSREGRHGEVQRLARELGTEFPRNRLFLLEEGAAAIRAGRAAEAEAVLTRGLAAFNQDSRPKIPGERAIWLYKRGLARMNLNHPQDADVDLREALRSEPVAWVRGRIHVELGKIADLAGRRPDALAAYRTGKTACEAGNDPRCVAEANRLIRQPFSMTAGKD
jgi:tetratricopeptide (TPR) repeat protein